MMAVRDALNAAMDEEMAKDDDVFLMGEEVRGRRWSCVGRMFA